MILSTQRPKSCLVASKINLSQLLGFFLPCFKAMQKITLLQWYCCNVLIRKYDSCANYYSKYKAQSCQMLNILHSYNTNELWIPTNLRALWTKFSSRHFLQWDSNSNNNSDLCTLLSQWLSAQRPPNLSLHIPNVSSQILVAFSALLGPVSQSTWTSTILGYGRTPFTYSCTIWGSDSYLHIKIMEYVTEATEKPTSKKLCLF